MYIESITIKSFGQLHNKTINFESGVNIIEGENESGKSTIATFIKFMFYGLSGKAEKGGISERTRYISWDSKTASGTLTLTHDNGKRYRIERELVPVNRGAPKETFKIIDLDSNAQIKEDTTPDAYFIGVPEEVFMRTVFVSQMDGSKINGSDIHEAVENILFSADEAINTQKALKRLDEARVILLHKNRKGGKIYELVQDKQALKARLEAATKADEEIREKSKLYKELNIKLIKNRERLAVVAERIGHTEATEKLERLRNAKRLEQELSAIKAQLDSIHSQSENSFLPDREYIEKLRRLHSKIEFAEKEISHAKEEIESAEKTSITIEQTFPRFEINEGEESLVFISSKLEHSKAMKVFCFAFSILSFLCAVFAGVFFASGGILPGSIVAAAAVILVIGATFCFSISSKYKVQVEEEFDKYGVQSKEELIQLLDEQAGENARKIAISSGIDILNSKIERLKTDLEKLKEDANELLSKFGRQYTSIAELEEAANTAEQMLQVMQKLKNSYESKLAAYNANSVKYSEEEEQHLLAVIEESEQKVELDTSEYAAAKREYTFLSKSIEGLSIQINDLSSQLAELRATSESPIRLSEHIKEIETKEAQYRACHEAYELAYEKLQEASEKLRGSISPKLSKAASEFMRLATDGKYRTFGVDSSFSLQFRTADGNATHEVDFLSSGTQDLAYISLRLALVELLFDEAKPPIIFDESFSRLDDKRLCAVLAIIYSYSRKNIQAFVLTSHTRDSKILGTLEGCNVIQI